MNEEPDPFTGCALVILFCCAFWAGTILLWWMLR